MNDTATPAVPKPAATIILLRDGDRGLEILILRKASGKHFASGALVFPGGKVADADTAFAGHIGEDANDLTTLKIAAIREMYEECGIALARDLDDASLLDAAAVTAHQEAHDGAPILEMATAVPFGLATDHLVRFAHWITPASRPKRFDTHFFVAQAPTGQMEPRVDGYEIVEATWYRPQDLLDDVHAGRVKLVLPTMMNVMKLSEAGDVAQAIDLARSRKVIAVTPVRTETPDGERLIIPEEAGYGMTEIPAEFLRSA